MGNGYWNPVSSGSLPFNSLPLAHLSSAFHFQGFLGRIPSSLFQCHFALLSRSACCQPPQGYEASTHCFLEALLVFIVTPLYIISGSTYLLFKGTPPHVCQHSIFNISICASYLLVLNKPPLNPVS